MNPLRLGDLEGRVFVHHLIVGPVVTMIPPRRCRFGGKNRWDGMVIQNADTRVGYAEHDWNPSLS